MLIEGIDDSVLGLVSAIFLVTIVLMFNYIRNNLLSVNQANPVLHVDSIDAINEVRSQNNLNPSAPPAPDLHERNEVIRSIQNANVQLNCPICLGETVLPVETNCGHIFCANCIVQYWRHTNTTYSKIKCPMCRQFITLFVPLFSRGEEHRHNLENASEIMNSIKNYNKRFSGEPRPLMDYITDIPVLLRHIFNELFSFQGLEMWHRIRWSFLMIIGLLYFLSPFDIIPELVFGIFGFLDDIFVLVLVIIYITVLYRQVIANRT